MTLGIRKTIVLVLVAAVFLLANMWLVMNWLQDKGVIDMAKYVRTEFLTGTAITIINDYSYCTSSLNCLESLLKRPKLEGFPFFIIFIRRRLKQVFVFNVWMPFKQASFVPASDCARTYIQSFCNFSHI